jgi:hypothetical protein
VDADGYEVADLNTGQLAINRYWLDTHDEHWAGHGPDSHIERTQGEIDANARLIAASPSLLQAVKALLVDVQDEHEAHEAEDEGFIVALHIPYGDVLRARHAIAKAESTKDDA